MRDTLFVGLEVHKATISVAVASAARGGEVRCRGSIANRGDHVGKLVERVETKAGQLHFRYEAGPCGYGLYRQLSELGHACEVVAPSLILSGDRVKTDRRDAAMLAKLHRAGELTAVRVPDESHEAMRDPGSGRARRQSGSSARRGSISRASCCATAGSIPGRRAGPSPVAAG